MVRGAVVACATMFCVPPAIGAVIYQSRRPPLATTHGTLGIADADETSSFDELPGSPSSREFLSRVGDQITFSGSDRYLTRFSTRLVAAGESASVSTIDVMLTLYENNGGIPGSLIWTGTTAATMPPTGAFGTFAEVVFAPNVIVPNSICYGIAFTSILHSGGVTRSIGVLVGGDATIGSSPNTVLEQLSADGSWSMRDLSSVGAIFRNVDAVVEAVPPPAGGLPLVCFSVVLRRKRR